MKKTKHKHNSNRDQRKFDIDYIFRNQDPDKRTCRQWLNDMQKKHGINWINQRYTKQTITLEDKTI